MPPQTTICEPVHTATWWLRASGASTVLMGFQTVLGHGPIIEGSSALGHWQVPWEQTDPGVPAQSERSRHWTQVAAAVSQMGVGYEQSGLDRQEAPPSPVWPPVPVPGPGGSRW